MNNKIYNVKAKSSPPGVKMACLAHNIVVKISEMSSKVILCTCMVNLEPLHTATDKILNWMNFCTDTNICLLWLSSYTLQTE